VIFSLELVVVGAGIGASASKLPDVIRVHPLHRHHHDHWIAETDSFWEWADASPHHEDLAHRRRHLTLLHSC
jgi:hypothetical protein